MENKAALGSPFINANGLYFAESEVRGKRYFFFPRRCMDCFEQADSCWLFYISQLLHHLPFQRVEFKSCIMYVTSASFSASSSVSQAFSPVPKPISRICVERGRECFLLYVPCWMKICWDSVLLWSNDNVHSIRNK